MSFYSRRNYGWGGFAPQETVEVPVAKRSPTPKLRPRLPESTAVAADPNVQALFKETRKRLGLTQTEFAKILGTNQTTISAIERGGKSVRAAMLLDRVKKLAEEK